ncbi:YciI family protein [Labedaea rhizosphaerae]|uniref:YCII-related domain-containing protein n=1 Tax=Labedaea rhizosphaerae TaxID=598644 RepID=A0A4R6SFB7_LABRH|nr:YciI family protein [Labedaea rhizosphaerae]TDQ00305.1 YCII-related domain-containing protein [Labedaea rhizosphaerae]
MDYVLLVHGPSSAGDEVPAWAAAFLRICLRSGIPVSGQLLAADCIATSLLYSNGRTDIVDGPIEQTSRQLGACFTVECPHLDAVLELLRDAPILEQGSVEIRPVDPVSQQMWLAG